MTAGAAARLKRFQHGDFAVDVASGAHGVVDMFEAQMLVQADGLRQAGGGFQITTAEALLTGKLQCLQRQAFCQALAALNRQEIHFL